MKNTLINITFPVLFGFMILTIFSCGKNSVDTQAPFLQIKAPFEGAEYRSGEFLPIDIGVTDNDELMDIQLRVHTNLNDHSENAPDHFFIWDTTFNVRAFGQSSDFKFDIYLDENLPYDETYHLVVDCGDQSGNRTGWQEVEFVVKNFLDNTSPVISLMTDTMVAAFANNMFAIIANVEDNQCLDMVEMEMMTPADTSYFSSSYLSDEIDGATFEISEFIMAPSIQDEYTIVIRARDKNQNISITEVILKVL